MNHYGYVNRKIGRNPLLTSLSLYVLGATGLTLSLCLYSRWIAGRFWFLGPTLEFTCNHLGRTNPWKAPLTTWLPGADWLVLPVLTALGCALFFYRLRSGLRCLHQNEANAPLTIEGGIPLFSGTAILYQLQFLFALLLMIGWEWRGQPVLQCPEYASLLLPAALLAFGAQLCPHVERLGAREVRIL